tara:strand:- start:13 stop:177 length:165 start_codon:yes stop_codon:yes gene_type:complete
MTISMTLPANFDDPIYLILNVVALTAVGFMIWFGYKFINKGGKDGGVKVKMSKL